MRFFPQGLYKHKRCLDMRILVLKTQYQGANYTKVRAYYVSPSGNLYWPSPQTLVIRKEEYKNWEMVG